MRAAKNTEHTQHTALTTNPLSKLGAYCRDGRLLVGLTVVPETKCTVYARMTYLNWKITLKNRTWHYLEHVRYAIRPFIITNITITKDPLEIQFYVSLY